MLGTAWVFAEARGFKAEADRARALARTTSGRLQGELHQIAALYERIADGKDPDYLERDEIRLRISRIGEVV